MAVRRSFELSDGKRMEYEFIRPAREQGQLLPIVVSVPGRGQTHLNGLSQRLASTAWTVAVPLRPEGSPPFFEGDGSEGDGMWHMREFVDHLIREFQVSPGRFVLAGVSNGGNTVLRFATLWPEMCCGLLVVTGCLRGLVDIPEGLKRLQGIPIDMYVGTRDECGFHEPMIEMEEGLRAVDHKPRAKLTVLKDAGHCCSPLIEDYMIHGKIASMLLRAGVVGDRTHLTIAPTPTRSDDVEARLICFGRELGLECRKQEDGRFIIKSCNGASICLECRAASAGHIARQNTYAKGDSVEVWSNSLQTWVSAVVADVRECEGDLHYNVTYSDQGTTYSKMITSAHANQYLRLPGTQAPAIQDTTGFAVGDGVAVWSESKQHWFEDGSVISTSQPDGITVSFSGGRLEKSVLHAQANKVLRRLQVGTPSAAPKKPLTDAGGPGSPLSDVGSLRAGDRMAVWSESRQAWYEDGEVVETAADGSVLVRFAKGGLNKRILGSCAAQVLRLLLA